METGEAEVVERCWQLGSRTERSRYGLVRVNPAAPGQSLGTCLERPSWPPGELRPALAAAADLIGEDCRRAGPRGRS